MYDTLRGQHTLTKRQHSGGPRVGQNFTANYILPSWSQDEMTNAHLSLCQLWDKLQTESPVISQPPIRAVPARQLASDTPHTRPWLWDHKEDRDPGKKHQATDVPHPQWAGLAFLPPPRCCPALSTPLHTASGASDLGLSCIQCGTLGSSLCHPVPGQSCPKRP